MKRTISTKKIVIMLFLLGVFFTIYLLYQQFLNHTQTGCQISQGKWASAKNTCITRSCYSEGDCGLWYTRAIHYYDQLKEGDNLETVYFLLGERFYPYERFPDNYSGILDWSCGYECNDTTYIHFKNGKLTKKERR